MQQVNLYIQAGQALPYYADGTFLRVKTSPVPLVITLEGSGQTFDMEQGQSVTFPQNMLGNLRITNTSQAAAQVVLLIGNGDFRDSSLSGTVSTVTVQAQTVKQALVTVNSTGNAAAPGPNQLCASNAGRKGVRMENKGTADVEIGPAGVTVGGGRTLSPGSIWIEETAAAAAWYAVSASDGQSVMVEEVS